MIHSLKYVLSKLSFKKKKKQKLCTKIEGSEFQEPVIVARGKQRQMAFSD